MAATTWEERFKGSQAGSLKGGWVWLSAWILGPYLIACLLLALMTDWSESDVFLLGLPRLFKGDDDDEDDVDEDESVTDSRYGRVHRMRNYSQSRGRRQRRRNRG